MRRTKRALALILAVLLAAALLPLSAAAAGGAFRVYFQCDKDSYAVGETAVVSVYLQRTDSDAAYALYNFTDQVVFNTDLLQFVAPSNPDADAAAGFRLDAGVGGNGSPYVGSSRFISLRYQYISTSGTPSARASTLLVATLRFKVLADCHTPLRHSGVEVWTSPLGDAGDIVAKEDAAIIAGTPATYDLTFSGGEGAAGSTADMTGVYSDATVELPACGYSKAGKTFGGWYDGTKIYPAGAGYTVKADAAFTAVWNPVVVTYSAARGGDAIGVYTATSVRFYTGASMSFGTAVTLTATPSDGYRFDKWSDGVTDNPRSITVMGDVTLEAQFSLIPVPSGGGNVPVIVDGETYNIGSRTEEEDVTTVTVDPDELEKRMEDAHSTVVVPVAAETETVAARLVVKNVEDMAEKNMTLSVVTDSVSYNMRAVAVDTAAVMTALGATEPEQVPVNVTITQLTDDAVTLKNGVLVLPPVEFSVTAEYGGKTYEVEGFEKYVTRIIEIPSGVDATRITTAVVVENGTERHVPTNVYMSGGKWYAKISSRTNSVYALVYSPAGFADAKGKWFDAVVTEMAGRGIINGYDDGTFGGDRNITRAEFAAIVVRALGLPSDGDASAFTDVAKSAWYYGAVGTAYEYGIVGGRGNGIFDPQSKITRQEAMQMVCNAAKVAEFDGVSGALSAFSDAGKVSQWAMAAAEFNVGSGLIVGSAGKLNPLANITRGETATVILRLLQKSELVDVRTVV